MILIVNWRQWEVVGEGLPAEVIFEEKGEWWKGSSKVSISGCSIPDPQHSTFISFKVGKSLVRSKNKKKAMWTNLTDARMEGVGSIKVIGHRKLCPIDIGKKFGLCSSVRGSHWRDWIRRVLWYNLLFQKSSLVLGKTGLWGTENGRRKMDYYSSIYDKSC